MNRIRLICLMLAAAVVFAHSALPHHHHPEGNHSHEGIAHHHQNPGDFPDKTCDEGSHSFFTDNTIGEIFLKARQTVVNTPVDNLISVVEWQFFLPIAGTTQYIDTTFDIPPFNQGCLVSFRGPPVI